MHQKTKKLTITLNHHLFNNELPSPILNMMNTEQFRVILIK